MKKQLIPVFVFVLLISVVSAREYTFEVENYQVQEVDGYEIITADNLIEDYFSGLALAKGVETLKFTQNQPVEEIRLVEFTDPVELNLNLPSVDVFDEFMERDCYSNTREPEFYVNDPIISDNEAIYNIEITPIEVVDCENGDVKLYLKAVYEVVHAASPVRIEKVSYTPSLAKGEPNFFTVQLNLPGTGEIKVLDGIGEEVVSESIDGQEEVSIQVESLDSGYNEYTVEYWENGKRISFANVEVMVEWGNIDFKAYVSEDPNILPIKITLNNNLDEEIEVDLIVQLKDWEQNVDDEVTLTKKAVPGENVYDVNLEINEDTAKDDVTVIATYNGEAKSVTHNTLMRIDPEVAKRAKEALEKETEEKTPTTTSTTSLIFGIIVAIVLTLAVVYVVFKYMRTTKNE